MDMGGWSGIATGIGFGVGTLVGVTGMGAGSLLTPLLVWWLGVDPVTAVGSSLAHAALMKAVGTWRHARLGTIEWVKVRWLALGSLPAVVAAGIFLGILQHQSLARANLLVGKLLGVALLLAALILFWRALGSRSGERWGGWLQGSWGPSLLVLVGSWVGVLVGLTSVGSGSLLIPVLALGSAMPASRLVGTDMAHALLLMGAGALVHASLGNVDGPLVASLLAGSIPGIWIGSLASVRLPDSLIRKGMALMLLNAGLRMVLK
jgi:uncharacterized membrane protein YfcA